MTIVGQMRWGIGAILSASKRIASLAANRRSSVLIVLPY